ncbi:MAG: AAA family ATPase [Cyanobacteria bacterium P01_A01_bin.68]
MLAKYSYKSVDISIKLPGYEIIHEIYAGGRTRVFSGIRESDNKRVVIKLMSAQYPTFDEVTQFRHQYTILKSLDIPGVIQAYDLKVYRNGYALIMEDMGGISLEQHIKTWKRNLVKESEVISNFLKIAVAIAEILEQLHQHQIIHKDIKPANILIHPDTKEIKLIDFSIASVLAKEIARPVNTKDLEGTLFYLSPEQTGRMNRGIDYRSDFYSLGITFYELLTGTLPFQSDDPMEIVHFHIAKQAAKPSTLNSHIPSILDQIIAKLIAKNAEDRYQSASGLKYDLEKCLQQWEATNNIVAFDLCSKDISQNFNIPEKLYGREAEVQRLLAAFERITEEKTELFLVSGSSGVGKTAVINEVHKPIVQKHGYFIQGKYDQLHRDIPFAGFVEAFRDLIKQILSESDRQLQDWKTEILQALGEQAQVIVDIVPELEQIIGEQPQQSELSGIAAQNRFNLLLQRFVNVFARKKHPLVIFIDDLQWADAASLQLIQSLMSDSKASEKQKIISLANAFDPVPDDEEEGQCLLLLGAYRDNEVSLKDPLYVAIREMKKIGAKVEIIELQPLNQTDLNRMVSETLHCEQRDSIQLTQLIFNKTKGNPFFSHEFIKSLYKEKLVKFSYKKGHWECEIGKIRELALTDDVVEFMALQITRLPMYTQEVLKVAACIGNRFDLRTLAIMHQDTEGETASKFWPALKESIILPTNDGYKLAEATKEIDLLPTDEEESLDTNSRFAEYKFAHDRVQQAAYSLLPENEKLQIHLNLGKLLLQNIPLEEREENVFIIVNQFNKAKTLVEEPAEIRGLANMNLIAGRKAIVSTAYVAAGTYLSTGIQLLENNSWETDYDLSLGLYETAAEAAYLAGDFEQTEIFIEIVLANAKTLLEKIKVYEVRIQAYGAQNKALEAVNIALKVLKDLGIEFPQNPTESYVQNEIKKTSLKITTKIENLIDLPEMTELSSLAKIRILSNTTVFAYQATPQLMPLICLEAVNLSLKYGNAPLSAFSYVVYGIILCGILGDIESGYKFGKLAESLVYKSRKQEVFVRVLETFNQLIRPWREHIKDTLKHSITLYSHGIEKGDLEFAAYATHTYIYHAYFLGYNLPSLKIEIVNHNKSLQNLKQKRVFQWNQIYQQAVLNLIENYKFPTELHGEIYSEYKMLAIHYEENDGVALLYLYLCKLQLCYFFNDYLQSLENAKKAEDYINGGIGTFNIPQLYFYSSLAKLAEYQDKNCSEQQNILCQITSYQETMRHWADHASMNYLHKYALVEAERHRVLNNKLEAIEYYDRAIAGAQENEYIHEEALANELAAKFYLAWGKEKIAQTYMNEAYYCYTRWGAKAKVKDLEERYPELLASIIQQEKDANVLSNHHTIKTVVASKTTNISNSLDLATAIKASQALAGEIDLEQLLSTILKVVMENAGASKCVLVLKAGEDSYFQVSAVCSGEGVRNNENIYFPYENLDSTEDVPISVINYVRRTKETLLISDVLAEKTTSRDKYIIKQQPKCILCFPLMNQGKLIGSLYLENNLIREVFTNERIEILKLIATQSAISLENAILYKNLEKANESLAQYNQSLEKQVEQRTKELQQKNQSLQKTLQELQNTQIQLIQSEKMSSLGQMIAGIAHEINNPINFIHGNIDHTTQYMKDLINLLSVYQQEYPEPTAMVIDKQEEIDLDFLKEDLQKTLDSMKLGSSRIRNIVLSLRNFSRLDESEMKLADIHEGIDNTLMILQHRLQAKGKLPEIKFIKEYGELPEINCYPGQLNQVFMNILSNAIDAFEESSLKKEKYITNPEIRILTKITNTNQLAISISDNALGIPEEVQNKIFDPFFTTKPVGSGTGLGLSISYQIIVERHQGKLSLDPVHEQGINLLIEIPLI